MKVIDILNKIANGEEIPEKFRFAEQIYEKQGSYIVDEDGDGIFESICGDFSNINDEIEIIEEDKKISNLIYYNRCDFDTLDEFVAITTRDIFDKINEIIDYINKEK